MKEKMLGEWKMYTVKLQDIGRNDIGIAGGKGANLGELIQMGCRVPDGFIIKTNVYEDVMTRNGIDRMIAELEKEQSKESKMEEVYNRLLQSTLDVKIRDAIIKAYEEMGENQKVAIRSSATAEDLPDASFAGQQETYLNIQDTDVMIRKIMECYASLWGRRAYTYRKVTGYSSKSVALALVVQEMVDADISGVMFTSNPETGNDNEVVINASYGLGESIVSGKITPDSYVFDKRGTCLKKRLGEKETKVVGDRNGTKVVANTEEERGKEALSLELGAKLVKEGKRIENHYQAPMDIEWAIKDGEIYILQARQITTIREKEEETTYSAIGNVAKKALKRISFSLEHCPIAYYPLDFDLGMVISDVRTKLFGEIGFDSQREFEMDDLGVLSITKQKMRMNRNFFSIPFRMKTFTDYNKNSEAGEALFNELTATLKELETTDIEHGDFKQTKEIIEKIYQFQEKICFLRFRYYILPVTVIVKKVNKIFQKAGMSANEVFRNLPYHTWLMNKDMVFLANQLKNNKELVQRMEKGLTFHDMREDFEEETKLVDEYLKKYGWKTDFNCYPYTGRSWNENKERFFHILVSTVLTKEGNMERATQVKVEMQDVDERLKKVVPPKKWETLRGNLNYFRVAQVKREESQYMWETAFAVFRRVIRHLVELIPGAFETEDDIKYCRIQEVYQICDEGKVSDGLKKKVKDRKDARQLAEMVWEELKQKVLKGKNDGLRGVGASRGVATGKACVVERVEDFDKVEEGTILVCHFTEPEWTPLFAKVKAAVTDTGGELSHAAIVAREYGMPAVLGVGNATSIIKDGDELIVDGTKGVVTILN